MVWYQQINLMFSREKSLCLISLPSFPVNLSILYFWHSVSSVHHLEAFAWWSDLMVDHAETFLCLYSADMDAALEVQLPDSWDSFPLFQLLNDFLRMDCESLPPITSGSSAQTHFLLVNTPQTVHILWNPW